MYAEVPPRIHRDLHWPRHRAALGQEGKKNVCVCISIPSLILLRKWSGSNSKGFKLQVSNVALLFDGHETHSNGEIYPIHLWPSAERVSPSPSGSGGSDPATALAAGATLARPGADNMAWQLGFPWGSTTNRQGFIDHHSWGVTGWIPKTSQNHLRRSAFFGLVSSGSPSSSSVSDPWKASSTSWTQLISLGDSTLAAQGWETNGRK